MALATKKNDDLIYDEVSEQIIDVTSGMVINEGAKNVTVRKIITSMGVTNRVFYNRYRNVDEVLHIIYKRMVIKMHDSLESEFDLRTDFFNYVIDVAVKVLVKTYEVKNQFSHYMFEFDSSTDTNRLWWTEKIKEIINIAKETGQLKDVDSEMLSYTVWCFFRGYNADVVKRQMSINEAVERFKFGLSCLFDGVRRK